MESTGGGASKAVAFLGSVAANIAAGVVFVACIIGIALFKVLGRSAIKLGMFSALSSGGDAEPDWRDDPALHAKPSHVAQTPFQGQQTNAFDAMDEMRKRSQEQHRRMQENLRRNLGSHGTEMPHGPGPTFKRLFPEAMGGSGGANGGTTPRFGGGSSSNRQPSRSTLPGQPIRKIPFPPRDAVTEQVLHWNASADPLAGDRPKFRSLRESVNRAAKAIAPPQPSPYLVIGNPAGSSGTVVLYDLAAGRVRGTVPNPTQLKAPYAVSPQQGLIAGMTTSGNGSGLKIASIVQRRALQEITVAQPVGTPQAMCFLGEHTLLLTTSSSSSDQVILFDVATGRETQRIRLDDGSKLLERAVAVSPGGRQFAFLTTGDERDELHLYSADNGERIGHAVLPGNETTGGSPVFAHGLAFSDDGESLATVLSRKLNPSLLVWNVNDGTLRQRLLDDRSFTDGQPVQMNEIPLQWVPDGQHIFVAGRLLIDVDRGEVTHDLGDPGVVYGGYRRVLDGDRVLNFGGQPGARSMTVGPLPPVNK